MRSIIILAPTMIATSAIAADLPRSLSFANETSTRINSTVPEGSNNEKEVEFGDVDNDGDMDIVVAVGSSDFGERRNKLYINDGGVFNQSSLVTEFSMTDVTRNAFIRDFTGDGWADIYVINDSNSGGFAGGDHLYVALHSGGVLTGYSEEGATRIASGGQLGAACGGASADFDGDGDIDVYSGNYPGPSQDVGLYNDGSGNLANLTSSMVPSDNAYTVDVALGDMNGDGKDDLLVSNWSANFIYYNDNAAGSSGEGDFRYTGSAQNVGDAVGNENAMEAADFDNDGDLDIYWGNRAANSSGDRILVNNGNDGANKATFTTIDATPSTMNGASRKASVADFNEDGRVDIFVAAETGNRPVIMRNTTVEGTISFVDWSPRSAIPTGSTLRGWHGAVFDTNDDGDIDIVIGGFNGDHLIENTLANEVTEASIGGTMPTLWNIDPVAVLGSGAEGESDTYNVNDASTGFMSVVLNGDDDYRLEILDAADNVLSTIDRGGLGVEEAVMVNVAGTRKIRVTVLESAGGGKCGPPDFDGNCVVDFTDLVSFLAAYGCTDCDADIDGGGAGFSDLLLLLAAWGDVDAGGNNDYLLEVLGRTN